jgi:hypothetical protein
MGSTWQEREQRMLEVIRDAEEAGEQIPLWTLAERLGLEERLAELTLGRLQQARYVRVFIRADWPTGIYDAKLTERGLRQVGVWPSEDPYAALVDMLQEQLEAETDPGKRSRLRALLVGVTTAGREVVTELAAAWMRQRVGLP